MPPPGDLPNPGIKPVSLMTPDGQAGSLAVAPPQKPRLCITSNKVYSDLLLHLPSS